MPPKTMLSLDIRPIATSKKIEVYTHLPILEKTAVQLDMFVHCYIGKSPDNLRRVSFYEDTPNQRFAYPYVKLTRVPFDDTNPNIYSDKLLGSLLMKYYYANMLTEFTLHHPDGRRIRNELGRWLVSWRHENDPANTIVQYNGGEYQWPEFFDRLFKDWKLNPNVLTPEKSYKLPPRYRWLDKKTIDWHQTKYIHIDRSYTDEQDDPVVLRASV